MASDRASSSAPTTPNQLLRTATTSTLATNSNAANGAPAMVRQSSMSQLQNGSLPPHWRQLVDQRSGKTYYHNRATNETTWKRPVADADQLSRSRSENERPTPTSTTASATSAGSTTTTNGAHPSSATNGVTIPNGHESPAHAPSKASAAAAHGANGHGGVNGSAGTNGDAATTTMTTTTTAPAEPSAHAAAEPSGTDATPTISTTSASGQTHSSTSSPMSPIGGVQAKPEASAPIATVRPKLPGALMSAIQNFKLDSFAQKHFAEHKKGFLRRKMPLDQLLVFSKDKLSNSLIRLENNMSKDAVYIFSLIQTYMKDRSNNTGFNDVLLVQTMIKKAVEAPPLRDEMYCQLCKQVTKNPNIASELRGWELMTLACSTFPATKEFEQYLLSFFDGREKQSEGPEAEKIQTFAKYCASKLTLTTRNGGRKVPPEAEILRVREAPFKPSVFNVSLDEVMLMQKNEKPDLDLKVPMVLDVLSKAVERLGGFKTTGIFRVPGDSGAIQTLKVRIDKGEYEINETDPNVPGGLLKLWFRELPDPLIPEELYDAALEAAQSLPAALEIVNKLQPNARAVMLYLLRFLNAVAAPENVPFTKMGADNVAMVFAPNVLRCTSLNPTIIFENTRHEKAFLKILIENVDSLPNS